MSGKFDSFSKKSDVGKSILCSAFLTFAMFSILPFSMASVIGENNCGRNIRVWSLSETFSDGKNENGSKTFQAFPAPPSNFDFPVREAPAIDAIINGTLNIVQSPVFDISREIFSVSKFASDGEYSNFSATAFELSTLDRIPRRLRAVSVEYPQNMLAAGREGVVRLKVVIETDGSVSVEGVEDGSDAAFVDAARSAAEKMLFESPKKNGESVRAHFILPIPFRIQR